MKGLAVPIAAIFLIASGSVSGQHVDSVDGVFVMNADGGGQRPLFPYPLDARSLAVSPDGTKITYYTTGWGGFDIWVCDVNGENARNVTNSADVSELDPAWSPDGKEIVFSSNRDGNSDVFIMDLEGTNFRNITNHVSTDNSPSWSPSGNRIAFSSHRDGHGNIYVMAPDGSNLQQLTFVNETNVHYFHPRWSPGGEAIAFVAIVGLERHIYLLEPGSSARPLVARFARATNPTWSPDGAAIAFSANLDGSQDIFTIDLSRNNLLNLTNGVGGNSYPAWLPGGQIVFATRRLREDMRMLGPTTVTTIIDEGGVSFTLRNGNVPPYQHRRTRADGTFEYIPLTPNEAEQLLRQRGIP